MSYPAPLHRDIAGEYRAKTAAHAWLDAINGKAKPLQFINPDAEHALDQWNAALAWVTGVGGENGE